jgi:hypothetical protein
MALVVTVFETSMVAFFATAKTRITAEAGQNVGRSR